MKHAKIEKLATEEVGLTGSPLVFVNRDGGIVAVFVKTRNVVALEDAIQFAETLGEREPVWVEDSTGIAWENRASERRQRDEDDY